MSAIEPVSVIPPRPRLTKAQRVRLFDLAAGLCHLCGQTIKHGEPWQADHVEARQRGGSDDLANLKPAHEACHKLKTADDVKAIAKTRRTRAAHLGIKGARTPLSGPDRETRQQIKAARSQDRTPDGKPPVPRPRALFV